MIKNFMKYYKPYMGILISVVIGTLLMAGFDLIFPVVVRNIIDEILPARDEIGLYKSAGLLLVLYLINFAVSYGVQYYGHIMSASIEHDMRNDLFAHIEKQPFRYFDNEKTGQLLSRITSDVIEVSELAFRGPNDVLLCGIIMSGTIVAMLIMNWQLALLVGGLLIAKSIHTVKNNSICHGKFRDGQISKKK